MTSRRLNNNEQIHIMIKKSIHTSQISEVLLSVGNVHIHSPINFSALSSVNLMTHVEDVFKCLIRRTCYVCNTYSFKASKTF